MRRLVPILVLILTFQTSLFAAQSDVLTVDLDDVINTRKQVGVFDFAGLIFRIAFKHPTILSALFNFNEIDKMGKQVAKEVNGSANVIHAVLDKLKEQGYPDLSDYEQEIIERSMNPIPNHEVINFLRALKQQGYTLVAATNQDYLQNKAYRKSMKNQGVDIDSLFDGIVTTRVNHLDEINGRLVRDVLPYRQMEAGVYMLTDPKKVKPDLSYYEDLRTVAKKFNPKVQRIIHVDDKKENVEGAQGADFEAIQFYLPAGSALKSSSEELNAALDSYKQRLGQLGIVANLGAGEGKLEAEVAD